MLWFFLLHMLAELGVREYIHEDILILINWIIDYRLNRFNLTYYPESLASSVIVTSFKRILFLNAKSFGISKISIRIWQICKLWNCPIQIKWPSLVMVVTVICQIYEIRSRSFDRKSLQLRFVDRRMKNHRYFPAGGLLSPILRYLETPGHEGFMY